MVDTEWTTTDCDGVTLVAAVVHNDAPVERRVRVEAVGEGPTWPPRREGYPAEGWDGSEVVASLAPGERRAVGFATPEDPGDPPVRVETVDREAGGGERSDGPASPGAVVGRLGDPSPPRAAVPRDGSVGGGTAVGSSAVVGGGVTEGDAASDRMAADGDDPSDAGGAPAAVDVPEPHEEGDEGAGHDGSEPGADERYSGVGAQTADTRTAATTRPGEVPPPVAAWLDAVAERVDLVETAAGVESVTDAARAVEAAGGLAGVERAVEAVPADVRALRRIARRAERLADRADGRDEEVPLSALRGLA